MVRALRCWRSVTRNLTLQMAIAVKSQLGSRVAWLGFDFYLGLAVVAVQPDKLARKRGAVAVILDGQSSSYAELQSLLGLLEHLS